ncbi:DUF1302 family protein [Deltaproteobacteria bacterium TL4]
MRKKIKIAIFHGLLLFGLSCLSPIGFLPRACAETVIEDENSELQAEEFKDGDFMEENELEFVGEDEAEIEKYEVDLSNEEPTSEDSDEKGEGSELSEIMAKSSRFTFRQELAYRLEPGRTVVNRSSLRLEWEHLFASHYYFRFDGKMAYNSIYDYQDYPEEVADYYRFQTPLREAYLQASWRKWSFKAGKQIVVWGKSDSGVVTDVISPRDLTEGLFTPLEDSRIGQSLVLFDFYPASSHWTLVINPDPQVNRTARPGHEYAFPGLVDQKGIVLLEEVQPEFGKGDPELGLRWEKTREGFDLAVMAAQVLSNEPVAVFEGMDPMFQPQYRQEYRRYNMVGLGANFSAGNFLWKAELGYKEKLAYSHQNVLENKGVAESAVLAMSLGFDYTATGAYSLSMEGSNQHLVDWEEDFIGVRQNSGIIYVSWTKSFLHETLTPQYTLAYEPEGKEGMHQLALSYNISDQWSCKGEIDYFDAQKEDSLLGVFKDQHRLYGEVQFSF